MVIGVANQCDKGTPIIFIEIPGSFFLQWQQWFRFIIIILQITSRPSKCHIWYISQLCMTIVVLQKFISMSTTHCIFRGGDDEVKAGRFFF